MNPLGCDGNVAMYNNYDCIHGFCYTYQSLQISYFYSGTTTAAFLSGSSFMWSLAATENALIKADVVLDSRAESGGNEHYGSSSSRGSCVHNPLHLPLQRPDDQHPEENRGTMLRHRQNLQRRPQHGGQGPAGDRVLKQSWATRAS